MKQEEQRPANVTDVALWKLARTVHERHQHNPDTDTCGFCDEAWPCAADQRASLADAAARRPLTAPAARGPLTAPVVDTDPTPTLDENAQVAEEPLAVGAGSTRHGPMWRRLSRPHRKAG